MKNFFTLFINNFKIVFTNPKTIATWVLLGFIIYKIETRLPLAFFDPKSNQDHLFGTCLILILYFITFCIPYYAFRSLPIIPEISQKNYKTLFNNLSLQQATLLNHIIQKYQKITTIEAPFVMVLFYFEQYKPQFKHYFALLIQWLQKSLIQKNDPIKQTKSTLLEQHIAQIEQEKIMGLIKQKSIQQKSSSSKIL